MENEPFTPLFDRLIAARCSTTEGLVYGAIWRFCQRNRGYCYATHETIAAQLGMSERSVRRAIVTLLKRGFIIDNTPGLRNAPHRYQVTNSDSSDKMSDESVIPDTAIDSSDKMSDECKNETHRTFCPTDSSDILSTDSSDKMSDEDTEDTIRHTCARASATWLPDVQTQAAVLFGGNGHHARDDAEIVLQRSGWTLPTDELRSACIAFIRATGIAPPRTRSARNDWLRSLTEHIEEYGTERLGQLYKAAMERLDGLTISRPGALTKTLPVVAQPTRRRIVL